MLSGAAAAQHGWIDNPARYSVTIAALILIQHLERDAWLARLHDRYGADRASP